MIDKLQICSKCQKKIPIDEFYFQKKRNSFRKDCKLCCKKKVNENYIKNKDSKKKYNKEYNIKNKDDIRRYKQDYRVSANGAWASFASRRQRPNLSITKEEFIEWYKTTPDSCAYCGSQLGEVGQFLSKIKVRIKRVSFDIDRKDNNKGYEIDNIVKSCVVCNFHKADFFSYEDFKKISLKFIKKKIQKSDY
jgi:hypothetical protein